VEVLSSAPKHGIVESDIRHALAYALVGKVLAEDPIRTLYLGPDTAGNLLELVLLDRPHGPAVIHAMQARRQYLRLLEGGRS
jgi:hypothetical protein